MDYIVTAQNMKDILKLKKDKNTIYYLGREGHPLSYTIYLIHTDAFKKVWYDEDFCGHYGYDDLDFNTRAKKILKTVDLDNIKIKYCADGSTNGDRDDGRNKDLFNWKQLFPGIGKKINFQYKTL